MIVVDVVVILLAVAKANNKNSFVCYNFASAKVGLVPRMAGAGLLLPRHLGTWDKAILTRSGCFSIIVFFVFSFRKKTGCQSSERG